MARVTRTDRSWFPLALPRKTGQGFLLVDGYATRSGVFEYRNEDGTVRREWRPPSEVSDATSVETLRLAPVTLLHPSEIVTIENVADVRVGQVGDSVNAEWPDEVETDIRVRVSAVLDDPDAIKAVEDKTMTQFSCGYSADLETVAGVTPGGEAYDAIQRNIRYNHLALVDVGRAGPNIGIRVDRADAPPKEKTTMKKLILDGVGYDAPEQTIEAVTAHNAKQAKAIADATAAATEAAAKATAAEGRADAATAAEKQAKKDLEAQTAKVAGLVKDRRALERKAEKVLGAEAFAALNLDELDDNALRVAVIKSMNADADLEGKDPIYIAAFFDVATANRSDAADKATKTETAGTLRADTATGTKPPTKVVEAKAKRIAARMDAWKPKA